MSVHYLTSIELHRDGQDVTANCGKVLRKAIAVEVLEPGSDRAIVTSLRDCRKCVEAADALKAKHYFSRVIAGNEADKRYLGRSGE